MEICAIDFSNQNHQSMRNKTTKTMLPLAAMLLGGTMAAQAQWGTTEAPSTLYERENSEIASMKTARTADGKTFMTWLQWSETEGWGYEMHMQLLDADGVAQWGESGMVVENKRNASWTADYWLVVTPEGDAVVSWADARGEEDAEYAYGHVSVLYKVSQDQKQLWGEDGLLLGEEYKFPATLYMFGDDLYAIMQSAEEYGTPQLVRLDADGEFACQPIDFGGQLIASEGTDIIAVYAGSTGTEAMRYDRDLKPVWEKPATVSTEFYQGYARQPYTLVSDGKGGVVIAFTRNLGMFAHMPIVQYVSADGEAVFGESVDVLNTENGDHDYVIIGVNTESETIMSAWALSGFGDGMLALGGQLMDFFGERIWGDMGIRLSEKESASGYGYGPMSIDPLSGDNWLVCFADEQYWGHSQIYFASYSSDGNENWRVPVGPICSVDDYVTYLEGSDYYLFWVDEETDDDWDTFYSIKSVKMSDIDTGIRSIDADAATSGDTRYYNLNGIRLSQPQNGLNIIRESDGTVKKALVRK